MSLVTLFFIVEKDNRSIQREAVRKFLSFELVTSN